MTWVQFAGLGRGKGFTKVDEAPVEEDERIWSICTRSCWRFANLAMSLNWVDENELDELLEEADLNPDDYEGIDEKLKVLKEEMMALRALKEEYENWMIE